MWSLGERLFSLNLLAAQPVLQQNSALSLLGLRIFRFGLDWVALVLFIKLILVNFVKGGEGSALLRFLMLAQNRVQLLRSGTRSRQVCPRDKGLFLV